MRFLPIFLAGAVLSASPALAQTPPANADTYKAIFDNGLVILLPDFPVDVKFTPDGKFTALGGASTGVWRLDGEKLCTTPNETLIEACAAYPAGKKAGDEFEIDAPGAKVTIRINAG